ncbi:MAG: hypothetical protein MHM6MM_009107 [Cercozoa sp. M6MM]
MYMCTVHIYANGRYERIFETLSFACGDRRTVNPRAVNLMLQRSRSFGTQVLHSILTLPDVRITKSSVSERVRQMLPSQSAFFLEESDPGKVAVGGHRVVCDVPSLRRLQRRRSQHMLGDDATQGTGRVIVPQTVREDAHLLTEVCPKIRLYRHKDCTEVNNEKVPTSVDFRLWIGMERKGHLARMRFVDAVVRHTFALLVQTALLLRRGDKSDDCVEADGRCLSAKEATAAIRECEKAGVFTIDTSLPEPVEVDTNKKKKRTRIVVQEQPVPADQAEVETAEPSPKRRRTKQETVDEDDLL